MDRALAPRPAVVELVGVAGAGKSTLLRRLAARDAGLLCRHGVWRLPRTLLSASALRTLPTCMALWRRAGTLAWEETKHVVRLEALFRYLRSSRVRSNRAVLLDEGPVFVLAWLRTIGRREAGPEHNARWWRRMVARWSNALDLIVVLDAPNQNLVERIRSRRKPHEVKTLSEFEIALFLDRYRESFADSIRELSHSDGRPVEVLRLRSDAADPDVNVRALLGHLNGRLHAR